MAATVDASLTPGAFREWLRQQTRYWLDVALIPGALLVGSTREPSGPRSYWVKQTYEVPTPWGTCRAEVNKRHLEGDGCFLDGTMTQQVWMGMPGNPDNGLHYDNADDDRPLGW